MGGGLTSIGVGITRLLGKGCVLLLFIILTLKLYLKGLQLNSVRLNGSVNILIMSLLLNRRRFDVGASTLGLNFVLFVFYIKIRTKPGFFSVFFHSKGGCLVLTLIVINDTLIVTLKLNGLFN